MVKVFNPVFNIKVVSRPKREHKDLKCISRKCLAVVTVVNGKFKAIVNYEKRKIIVDKQHSLANEQLILDFTEESLSLKDKIHVWLKEKLANGRYCHIIRDKFTASTSPGSPEYYIPLHENLLISGNIVRKGDMMQFDYDELISYNYKAVHRINDVKIEYNKPLFNE